ncbi:MAG TPA: 3-oxoacyl-ACP synthase, partial [Anaerostipes hadrus]|nr:3-oxoacyl-ACP synthase [Anaerostipes hadrus]
MSVKILGTGSFLPEKSVSNDDLSKVMDTNDEWISSRTGIRSRHISIEDTTSTMAVKAAEKALEDAGISAEELEESCRKCVRIEVTNVKALVRVLDEMKTDYNIIS